MCVCVVTDGFCSEGPFDKNDYWNSSSEIEIGGLKISDCFLLLLTQKSHLCIFFT
jgi:hypothetical protein